jgi:hypothetical protein
MLWRFLCPIHLLSKDAILEKLAANSGDVHQTFLETGIAERTLYRWRGELWQSWRRHTPPPSPPKPPPEFENDLQALAYLRRKIMNELISVADTFEANANFATPTQRTRVLSQLLDRLMKLDEHLKPYKPQGRIVFMVQLGIYIRTDNNTYIGSYSPRELPRKWKEEHGEDARLDTHWGDDTYTIIPDGVLMEALFQAYDLKFGEVEFYREVEDDR